MSRFGSIILEVVCVWLIKFLIELADFYWDYVRVAFVELRAESGSEPKCSTHVDVVQQKFICSTEIIHM